MCIHVNLPCQANGYIDENNFLCVLRINRMATPNASNSPSGIAAQTPLIPKKNGNTLTPISKNTKPCSMAMMNECLASPSAVK
jgi:hypothetical protein